MRSVVVLPAPFGAEEANDFARPHFQIEVI